MSSSDRTARRSEQLSSRFNLIIESVVDRIEVDDHCRCSKIVHDRHTKYTISFRAIIESGQIKTLPLPARSPNLNAYAERWVRSVKEECLSKIILFGERSLQRALSEYVAHYHAERNHQGKSNVPLFRRVTETRRAEPVQCRERMGGILNYYHQEAA